MSLGPPNPTVDRDPDGDESVEPAMRLARIKSKLVDGEPSPRVTVRKFLRWFGTYRRGYYKVRTIRRTLGDAGLITDPDFESAYIDSQIAFAIPEATSPREAAPPAPASEGITSISSAGTGDALGPETEQLLGGGVADPTYRIGRFSAANNPPVSVTPNSTLKEAVTLMLSYKFSQLPVMQNERVVKGVVSWTSIGARLALGCGGTTASDFMEPHREVGADQSFFAAIPVIVDNQYVLVRGADAKITGIVTTSDLSLEFKQLAEPFLLLGEIENHIRRLIDSKYTIDEVKAAKHPSDDTPIESVADLTFGSYVRLLEKTSNWAKLGIAIDQSLFLAELDGVRKIRNDVMHFDPDPLEEQDLSTLRRFLQLLQTLQEIGAT